LRHARFGWKWNVPIARHFLESGDGFKRAEEYAAGISFRHATDVQAKVISIDQVHVSIAGWAEEHGVACRDSGGAMGSGIGYAHVGLGFDDTAGHNASPLATDQELAQKLLRDNPRVAVEEPS
jgi:hypothetical protein